MSPKHTVDPIAGLTVHVQLVQLVPKLTLALLEKLLADEAEYAIRGRIVDAKIRVVHLARLAVRLVQNVLLVATKGRRRARLLEMAKPLLAGVREVDAAAVPTVSAIR